MTEDSTDPLDGIDTASVTSGDVDDSEVRAALSSSNPMVRQRGLEVCETLAEENVDGVRPFLDEVASLASDDNAAIALRAIAVLDAVVGSDPAALEDRVTDLVDAADSDVVDVQLTAATALGKLVVERPDLLASHVRRLIEAVRVTELDPEVPDYSDLVDDEVTRRTIREHEEGERRRRVSGRRTLINVVVAITEAEPRSVIDGEGQGQSGNGTQSHDVQGTCSDSSQAESSGSGTVVRDIVTLLDDVDPGVSGGAVDVLGELATANPDAVAPVSDRLIDCLDDDRRVVRARAVRALGRLGDDAAVPELRTVAETDDDEDVREIAEETADFLAGSS